MDKKTAPRKKLGQNFLIDRNISDKIVESLGDISRNCVMEIGPGRGALTFELAKRSARLVAVELDRQLAHSLKEEFKNNTRVDILHCDILKFDLAGYLKRAKVRDLIVVGNLPYYLTTPILEYLFLHIDSIKDIYITVQKEVGSRMTAHPSVPDYGSLTCFVNYFCRPEFLFRIKSGSFWPKPKVESSFLRLAPISDRCNKYTVKSEELLFKVMRSSFGQRRKKLYTSLSGILKKEDLKRLGCDEILALRPQDLKIEEFVDLSNLIFDFSKQQ